MVYGNIYNAPDDWSDILSQLGQLEKSDESLDFRVLLNARRFVDEADGYYPAPVMGHGYSPTLLFSWGFVKPAPIQIEVHPTHYEFYRFSNGNSDIWHFEINQKEKIPVKLGAALDQIFAV